MSDTAGFSQTRLDQALTGSSAPSCCICYTTDQHYLLPTFVSAIQARRHCSTDKADVAIFGFGVDETAQEFFSAACQAEGIRFRLIDADVIEQASAMMSRLFLTRFVASQYTHYLYVDSDVQITRSLDALIDSQVPEGCFMAANDPLTFLLPDTKRQSESLRNYFSSIGFDSKQMAVYFNTGVLYINKLGWEQLGLRAWKLFCDQGRSFRFPDQDVLNIVGIEARLPMSLAWNFPIFLRNSRVEQEINPAIYHFMSQPKPWQGNFPPWNANLTTPYADIITRYPSLAAYHKMMSPGFKLRYHMQQRFKKITEILQWGLSERRNRILSYEKACRASM